jgi:CobQ-like glutamine amidotransferase family enzyme
MELTIGWLYPSLMSTYGDRGNVICLQQRAQWRGISVQVMPLDQQTTAAEIHKVDVLMGGGAQDRQQELVMRDLRGIKAETLREKIEAGTPEFLLAAHPNCWVTTTNQRWVSGLRDWVCLIWSASILAPILVAALAISCFG